MYYYTVSITLDELQAIVESLTVKLNSVTTQTKKSQPFRVVVEKEPLDPEMAVEVCRFSLVVTDRLYAKNDTQAWKLYLAIQQAAKEIEEYNNANYIVVPPPRRGGPMGGGMHA